ncbi:sortase, partial [Microvirga sp. 3-52]|nr:sortase [Microvirga sp. 3-52]
DDRTVIRSTAPDEILTLSTCYPFSYIGSAPDRYIIYAK